MAGSTPVGARCCFQGSAAQDEDAGPVPRGQGTHRRAHPTRVKPYSTASFAGSGIVSFPASIRQLRRG